MGEKSRVPTVPGPVQGADIINKPDLEILHPHPQWKVSKKPQHAPVRPILVDGKIIYTKY